MDKDTRMECLSCGWRGEAKERIELNIRLQASPGALHEKACPNCKSIAVESNEPRKDHVLKTHS
jgi:hypothetical protein